VKAVATRLLDGCVGQAAGATQGETLTEQTRKKGQEALSVEHRQTPHFD
jgi:hypothetical protein